MDNEIIIGGTSFIDPNMNMPERMTLNLTSKRALEINEDADWLRVRVLLGGLYRKYGTFLVEVNEIGKYA